MTQNQRRFLLSLLVGIASYQATAAHHDEPGFKPLFDGKTLDGWDGDPKFWSVRDGAITGQTTKDNPTKGNTFIIWRGGEVADFELRLRFKIVGGNSGIQYRSEDRGNWVISGYQGDFESGDRYSGILYHEKGRGILAQRGQVTRVATQSDGGHAVEVLGSVGASEDINKVIRKEQWNDYTIIARGNHFIHIINGRVTCAVTDEDAVRFKESGLLALQLHAGPPMTVQFKDIRIKNLKPANISGRWQLEVQSEAGTGTPSFDFEQNGARLTGSYKGLFGERKVAGRVSGPWAEWSVSGSYEGQSVLSKYTASVIDGDVMKGTLVINDQYEAAWTGRRQ